MYGEHPIELGLDRADAWLDALSRDPTYQRLFARRFRRPSRMPVTRDNVVKALATLRARDRLGALAVRPLPLRPRRRARCRTPRSAARCCSTAGRCRASPVTAACTSRARWAAAARPMAGRVPQHRPLQPAGPLSYPGRRTPALYEVTRDPADVGKFKAPTLRNIAVTAPYMHDGSVATLDEVIDHYAAGGRTIADGPASRHRPRQPEQEPRRFAASR